MVFMDISEYPVGTEWYDIVGTRKNPESGFVGITGPWLQLYRADSGGMLIWASPSPPLRLPCAPQRRPARASGTPLDMDAPAADVGAPHVAVGMATRWV